MPGEPEGPAEMPALGAIVTEPDGRISFNELRRRQAEANSTNGGNRLLQGVAFLVLLILLAVAGWAAVHYRQSVVRLWPASARFYSAVGLGVNVTGIAITDIGLRQEVQDGTPILSVTGKIVNVSNRDQPIPKLRIVLLDDSKRELYGWTFDPDIPPLKPGAEGSFGTKLPSPPPDAHSATVSVAPEDARQ